MRLINTIYIVVAAVLMILAGLVFWRGDAVVGFLSSGESGGLAHVNMFEVAKDEEVLDKFLREEGPDKVMTKLLTDAGGGYDIDCHTEAHEIGRASYHIYKAEAFSQGGPECHSGYYHGAMEGLLIEEGTAGIADTVDRICDEFDTSFGIFECLHGVGHGIMAYENYDLLSSLDICGSLNTGFAQQSCYSGAFMENVVSGLGQGALEGHETEWLSDDPHYPCNALEDSVYVQNECYKMQTSWMLKLNNYDFERTALDCLAAPEGYVSTCFLSLGRDAAGHTLRDPGSIKEICLSASEEKEYQDQCILGGLNVIIDFFGHGLEGQASELCRILEGEQKEMCYRNTALRARNVFNESSRIDVVCETFEGEYKHLCSN